MVKIDNSNYNKVSVKTDSAVKLIETLKDLGVFKEKRKSAPRRKKTSLPSEDIRQDNDMGAGFTAPTQVRVEADTQGLTEEDVKTKTDALVAKIRDEVAQNRLEDLQKTTQNLFTLFTAVQPRIQRSEESLKKPFTPFTQSTTITEEPYVEEPDIQERPFTGTLNEGAPEEESTKQENIFTTEEKEIEQQGQELVKKQRLRTIRDKRKIFTDSYKLPELPDSKDVDTKTMKDYFINFMDKTKNEYDSKILQNKVNMFKAMTDIIGSTIL